MNTTVKRIIAVGAAALTASFTFVGVAHADSNSPTCHDQSCNGLMPEAAGCADDAEPLATFSADDGALVELRYSEACDAAWARVTGSGQGSGTCNGWNDDDYIEIRGYDWNGPGTDSYDACLRGGQSWTAMIGFGWNVKACYVTRPPWATDEPDIGHGCTGLH